MPCKYAWDTGGLEGVCNLRSAIHNDAVNLPTFLNVPRNASMNPFTHGYPHVALSPPTNFCGKFLPPQLLCSRPCADRMACGMWQVLRMTECGHLAFFCSCITREAEGCVDWFPILLFLCSRPTHTPYLRDHIECLRPTRPPATCLPSVEFKHAWLPES